MGHLASLPGEQQAIFWLAVFAAVCSTMFPVVYGIFAPWYRSIMGAVMMTHGLALAMALDTTVILDFLYFDGVSISYGLTIAIQMTEFAILALATLGMLVMLIRVQVARHRE